jgi:antitoxin FitA
MRAVSLSIKSVPPDLARALRERAARNHRSIQGELMHILESAVGPRPFRADGLLKRIQSLGLSTPAEATRMIRADRTRR